MAVNILLLINITLMYSAPLIFAALGGVISERSGVVNLALEGMMTIGALIATTVGYYSGNPWLGFLAGGLAGAVFALLHAAASVSLKADQTISGIAINFIAPGFALFLCRVFFKGATSSAPVAKKLPKILSWTDTSGSVVLSSLNVDITIVIAVLCVIVMWSVLYKTKWGLRIISVGEHPAAADTAGINVFAVRYACVVASGFLAGLGGGACSLAIVSSFSPSIISGKGFIALAAVIFGKWKPHGALGACLLFGFAQALVVMIGRAKIPIPSQVISMLPYFLTLAVLILFVGKSVAPKASGVPYEKGKR